MRTLRRRAKGFRNKCGEDKGRIRRKLPDDRAHIEYLYSWLVHDQRICSACKQSFCTFRFRVRRSRDLTRMNIREGYDDTLFMSTQPCPT